MADKTKIEWADRTWNVVLGCDRVSPGCDRCYAIGQAHIRASNPHPKVADAFAGLTEKAADRLDWTGKVNLIRERLNQPFGWKKPQKVFVNSLSDLFHDEISDEFIAEVFAVMAATPQHTYQLLTKRHGRMRSLLSNYSWWTEVVARAWEIGRPGPTQTQPDGRCALLNVWLGVSVEDQKWADIRIPALLDTPATVRWISAEPLLGPVELYKHLYPEACPNGCGCRWLNDADARECGCDGPCTGADWNPDPGLHWVVAGGESGPGARPMHPNWARYLRDQCQEADIPFLFKQWGAWAPQNVQRYGDLLTYAGHGRGCVVEPDGRVTVSWSFGGRGLSDDGSTPDGAAMLLVGKKAAGRLLDGETWAQFPEVQPPVKAG